MVSSYVKLLLITQGRICMAKDKVVSTGKLVQALEKGGMTGDCINKQSKYIATR